MSDWINDYEKEKFEKFKKDLYAEYGQIVAENIDVYIIKKIGEGKLMRR